MTGSDLKKWREITNNSQLSASKVLGCSRTALVRWEANNATLPRYIALACAAICNGIPPWGGC